MKLDISFSTKKFEDRIKTIEREAPAKIDTALFATAQYGINIILDRTQEGQGINGPFAPYSKSYAKEKREGWPKTKSRSAFSGDSSGIVNLNVTGRMTGSITATKGRGFARIGFSNQESAKKAYFNHRRRPFFGFNRNEKTRLRNYFRKVLFK
jgi:hypothetical protein